MFFKIAEPVRLPVHRMQRNPCARQVIPLIRRGEIYTASLDPVVGSEQGGTRPVVVIQNDIGNRYSPTVIILAITSATGKPALPTHVCVAAGSGGLARDSMILAEQMRTLDKRRLLSRIGMLEEDSMRLIDRAVCMSLQLPFFESAGHGTV